MTRREQDIQDASNDMARAAAQLRSGNAILAVGTWGAAMRSLGFARGLHGGGVDLEALVAFGEKLGTDIAAVLRPGPEANPDDVADVVVKGLEPLLRSGAELTEERLRDRANGAAQALIALYVIRERL